MNKLNISREIILAIVIIIFFAGLLYWVSSLFETITVKKDWGYTAQPRNDPLLAAQIFLENKQHKVIRLDNTAQLPALIATTNASLFILGSRHDFGQNINEKLVNWVHQGGHLIVDVPYHDENNRDFLLDSFGISTLALETQTADNQEDDGDVETTLEQVDSVPAETQETNDRDTVEKRPNCSRNYQNKQQNENYFWQSGDQQAELDLTKSFTLSDDQGRWNNIIQVNAASGRFTAITGSYIWRNPFIACLDHAHSLALLAADKHQSWFLLNQDTPSLTALLWRHAPQVILYALSFLILWFWYKAARFGKVQLLQQLNRRELGEHLTALGQLAWKHNSTDKLAHSLRQSILRSANLRYPGFNQWTDQRQHDQLAKLIDQQPRQIQLALTAAHTNSAEFTDTIKTLQRLRKHL